MKEARHDIPAIDPRSVRRARHDADRQHRLRLLPARGARRPDRPRDPSGHGQDPAREPAPTRRRRGGPGRGRRDAPRLAARLGRRGRDPVHARPRPPPGLHRRPGRGGPRGHARRDGRPRRRPGEGQPARPGRPRHRPLRPDRPVRDARRVRLQRRARVRPQRRALSAPALGADRLPRPARGAARDRDHPPGQPRVPGHGRHRPRRRRRRPGRLPRHARRHRFAHDDGQWPRRPRLRRRRHRGRGGPARPAALPADAPRRRCPAPRGAATRLDGHRPRPGRHRDAALARRRRVVRGVRRRRPGHPGAGRPDDHQQHEPRVRGDRDPLPDRRRDAHLPAPDRPLAGAGRARRALRQGPGPVATARRRAGLRRVARARPGERRAVRRGAAPAAGPGRAARAPGELPGGLPGGGAVGRGQGGPRVG